MSDTNWVATVTFATNRHLADAELIALDEVAGDEVQVSRRAGGRGFALTRDTNDADALITFGEDTPKRIGGTPVRVELVAVEVVEVAEYERRAYEPDIPDLVGTVEAGQLLGVTKQRVHQLHSDNPRFPAPVTHIGNAPVWTRDAVEWFNRVWERKPGRPAKAS